MNSVINNQAQGVEYSEYYKNLRKEVTEQNQRTAQLATRSSLLDHLNSAQSDRVEFSNQYNSQQTSDIDLGKLKEGDVLSAVTSLVVAIRQNSGDAYSSQNNLLANRIAALLKS